MKNVIGFDDRLRNRINDYISKNPGGKISRFVYSYRAKYKDIYGKEAVKEVTIRKLQSDKNHVFTEEEVKVISEVLKDKDILIDYYKNQQLSYSLKIEEERKRLDSNSVIAKISQTPIKNQDIITDDVLNEYVLRYIQTEADSPLIILCDDRNFIVQLLHKFNESFSKFDLSSSESDLEDCSFNYLYASIVCPPTDLKVGKMLSMASRIIVEAKKLYRKKHIVIIVESSDEETIKEAFVRYNSFPYMIEFHMDGQLSRQWKEEKKHILQEREEKIKEKEEQINAELKKKYPIGYAELESLAIKPYGFEQCNKEAYLYALECIPEILQKSPFWSGDFKKEVEMWLKLGNIKRIPLMYNFDWSAYLHKQYNIHKKYLNTFVDVNSSIRAVWEHFCKEGFPANWFSEECNHISILTCISTWESQKDVYLNMQDNNPGSKGETNILAYSSLEHDINHIKLTGQVPDFSESQWKDWLQERFMLHSSPFDPGFMEAHQLTIHSESLHDFDLKIAPEDIDFITRKK